MMERTNLQHWPHCTERTAVWIDYVSIDPSVIPTSETIFFDVRGHYAGSQTGVKEAIDGGARLAVVEHAWVGAVPEERLLRVQSPLEALQHLAAWYRSSLHSTTVVAVLGSCANASLDILGHFFASVDAYTSHDAAHTPLAVALSLLNIPKTAKFAFIAVPTTHAWGVSTLAAMVQPSCAVVTSFFNKKSSTEPAKPEAAHEIVRFLELLPNSGFAIVENHPSVDLSGLPCPCFAWNSPAPTSPRLRPLGDAAYGSYTVACSFPGELDAVFSLRREHAHLIDLLSIGVQVAWKCGVPSAALMHTLQTYQPEHMRTELWSNGIGTAFVNAPHCTSPFSFGASLDDASIHTQHVPTKVPGRLHLVFGGLSLPSSIERVLASLQKGKNLELYGWPKNVGHALEAYGRGMVTTHALDSLEEAISSVQKNILPQDTVIFRGHKKIPFEWLYERLEGGPLNTVVCINLAAVRANIERIRQKLPQETRIMVMVKAIAYGTDEVRISLFLKKCGVDILGVSYVDEGASLRKKGADQAIFVIHAPADEMKKAAQWGLEPGVCSREQVEAAQTAAHDLGVNLRVHLHVDTGMKRLGCRPEEALSIAKTIAQSPNLIFEGMFTHFCSADDPCSDEYTKRQASLFFHVADQLEAANLRPTHLHIANSSASIRFRFPRCTMVRVGLATYGFHASQASVPLLELRPAVSLSSKIVGFNEAQAGDTVSYGRTYAVPQQKARLAVLPIGYFDGIHRAYSGKGFVRIRGQQAPMVGRICMDYMMVDVSHIPEASIGDRALLFGEDELGNYLPPEALAQAGGSIMHELMACLGPRVQRLFIYDESLLSR